jgi:hypothetical protein
MFISATDFLSRAGILTLSDENGGIYSNNVLGSRNKAGLKCGYCPDKSRTGKADTGGHSDWTLRISVQHLSLAKPQRGYSYPDPICQGHSTSSARIKREYQCHVQIKPARELYEYKGAMREISIMLK